MAYQPIKIIAEEQTTDGHVNRETSFDSTPQSNKINYQTGLPLITATPKSLGGKGPRRVDMNGLFYLFSNNLFELQQGNFPTYNSAIVGAGKPLPDGYPQGAVLWYPAGGYFVKSLVADNTESDLTDTSKWAKITISAEDFATGLSGKADTNLANTTPSQSFKEMSVGWGMPDYSTVIIGLSKPFTAPTDGLISWNNDGTSNCTINGNTFYIGGTDNNNEGNVTLLLSKNDVISFTNDLGTPCFVSLKGAN